MIKYSYVKNEKSHYKNAVASNYNELNPH